MSAHHALLFGKILRRALALALLLMAALALPRPAQADPADIAAAARGVVRVVILGTDGGQLFPISHGTGFVVENGKVVTNAHVVEDAIQVPGLTIGIVPPQGGEAVPAKIVSFSPRNDLALIEATQPLRLPALAIAINPPEDSAMVFAVGYPMNVDRAQGLSIADVLKPQPPVKSSGFVSGTRPSREFDTVLHTAPIARGNSGGPLLDNCGRVIGTNSFGTESEGADAEFFFAVSARELLPFLRANDVSAQINGLPCRSMAELDAQEQAEAMRETERAMEIARREASEMERKRARALRAAELDVLAERENGMAAAALLLALALVAGIFAWQARTKGNQRHAAIAAGVTALALIGMLAAWFTRPGMDRIEQRAIASLGQDRPNKVAATATPQAAGEIGMICSIDLGRSRVTSAKTDDIPVTWRADGCVNRRTQYGLANGQWSRVFAPNDEEVVSVNRYDPERKEYRVERYLLGKAAMDAARSERAAFSAPECGAGDQAARTLGERQGAILALLPPQPNERLVFKCQQAAPTGGSRE
ncbi:serine protease [Tsuneonella sp. CC-YZS046]|uniref:S1 family peptidase n=1 Tax=Tsuneonella sp. CC-YZS046 TaxID=3042152 RepID=UPI002D77DF7D|nr:serine protease [Tsuneonella sp. CC-YZS046]WRO65097.1 serine protease [Tsuneonella sp. CC-YZS046]